MQRKPSNHNKRLSKVVQLSYKNSPGAAAVGIVVVVAAVCVAVAVGTVHVALRGPSYSVPPLR